MIESKELPSMADAHEPDWLEPKIPPPVIAAVAAVAMWGLVRAFPDLHIPYGLRLPAAALLATGGVALAASGIVAFRRARTTINPHKPGDATVLVSSGPYRFTRNPMYAGMLLVLLAWSAFLASPLALLGPAAFVAYITRFQIMPEERALRWLFGGAFIAYEAKVRRWL